MQSVACIWFERQAKRIESFQYDSEYKASIQ